MTGTLRRTVRSLRRSPGYAIASVVSVAVGLGLSAGTFAFIEALRSPQQASPHASRIFTERLRFGGRANPPSVATRVAMLRTIPGVEDVAVSLGGAFGEVVTHEMQRSRLFAISSNYWQLQGIAPRLGRYPIDDEVRADAPVIVTDEMWRREFANSGTIEGATVRIGDRIHRVAAVLPERVISGGFALVYVPFAGTDTLETIRETSRAGNTTVYVKLKPGVSAASLAPELDRVASNLSRDHVRPGEPAFVAQLVPMVPPGLRVDSFLVLIYMLGFGILAIGCANVSALTLARGIARRRDFAVRIALGASRRAIVREVLAEVGVVTLAGTALGIAGTFIMLGLLGRAMPVELTWQGWARPSFSAGTLAYCAAAFFVAVAIGGALPAIRAARIAPSEPLKDGAGTTTGRASGQFRLLLISELAVAMVLLMMASLETLSLRNILAFEYGFPAERIATASIRVGARRDHFEPVELASWRQRTIDAVRTTPGVLAAGFGGGVVPIDGAQIISDATAGGAPSIAVRSAFDAGAGFFAAMGVQIVEGRDFVEGDAARGGAVLSATAARLLFPRGGAVGHIVKLGTADSDAPWVPVVGVCADFWLRPTDTPEDRDPPVYVSYPGPPSASWSIVARADSGLVALPRALRLKLVDVLPPKSSVGTAVFTQDVDFAVRGIGYFVRMFAALGLAALALGALGLFSVMSYVVGQRSREFAVRVSLGATPQNVVRVVLRSALELALGGAAIGTLLSFWASAGLSSMLFGVKNTDPVSLVLSEALLIAVCIAAALGPAIRASRANPLDVIRAV